MFLTICVTICSYNIIDLNLLTVNQKRDLLAHHNKIIGAVSVCQVIVLMTYYSPSVLPILSLEAFFANSVALPVVFSIIEVIPNLSIPFLMPSKNVCQPKPNMARKNTITNIINISRDRIPIIGHHKVLPKSI
jgi:hypothetical protein